MVPEVSTQAFWEPWVVTEKGGFLDSFFLFLIHIRKYEAYFLLISVVDLFVNCEVQSAFIEEVLHFGSGSIKRCGFVDRKFFWSVGSHFVV